MKKRTLLNILRKFGASKSLDTIRYQWIKWKTQEERKRFKQQYPEIVLPPDYYMYETFSLDYQQYYFASKEAARYWVDLFEQYKDLNDTHILDWGCGPGRIIRHLPLLAPQSAKFYGCDYNPKYIDWCSNNLLDIQFDSHQVSPPLPYADASMDLIYGISIFTHLSEKGHEMWLEELYRILKPNGLLCITLHGDVFKSRLESLQLADYEKGHLVTVGNTSEGHRTYIAFHPPAFVAKCKQKFTLLQQKPGILKNAKPQQDIWLLQKA